MTATVEMPFTGDAETPREAAARRCMTVDDLPPISFAPSHAWPVPDVAACHALWDRYAMPDHIRAHSSMVAEMAMALARAALVSSGGADLHLPSVLASALLHDIAKDQPRHEAAGGALLRELGFSGVADIVAAHRDSALADDQLLTERELVYFADKLVRCHMVVDVEARFGEKLAQWRHDPEAAAAIEGRMQRALALRMRLEAEAGRPLQDILLPLRVGQPAWELALGGAAALSACPASAPLPFAGPGVSAVPAVQHVQTETPASSAIGPAGGRGPASRSGGRA